MAANDAQRPYYAYRDRPPRRTYLVGVVVLYTKHGLASTESEMQLGRVLVSWYQITFFGGARRGIGESAVGLRT